MREGARLVGRERVLGWSVGERRWEGRFGPPGIYTGTVAPKSCWSGMSSVDLRSVWTPRYVHRNSRRQVVLVGDQQRRLKVGFYMMTVLGAWSKCLTSALVRLGSRTVTSC